MNLRGTSDNQLLIDIFLKTEKFGAARQTRTIFNNIYYSGYDTLKVLKLFNLFKF